MSFSLTRSGLSSPDCLLSFGCCFCSRVLDDGYDGGESECLESSRLGSGCCGPDVI